MAGSDFGKIIHVSTWGESHGAALGAVLDGFPAGMELCGADLRPYMDRRRPGRNAVSTQRQEEDEVEILSGVFEGRTTGAPISLLIRNTSQRPRDYDDIADYYRPGHADFTYDRKYGIRDYRGGGRASGRETAARVACGAIAAKLLRQMGVEACAFTRAIGPVEIDPEIAAALESGKAAFGMPGFASKGMNDPAESVSTPTETDDSSESNSTSTGTDDPAESNSSSTGTDDPAKIGSKPIGTDGSTGSTSAGNHTASESPAALRLITPTAMPDAGADARAMEYLRQCIAEHDSAGGVVECVITGVPAGIGDPVFDKLDARLASALMSIGAVKAVEIGDGIRAAKAKGSENNDPFFYEEMTGAVVKRTNHSGGILGGISDGSPIIVRADIKPTPSIFREQDTVDQNGRPGKLLIRGRHDPVIVPRAAVVVECMCALVILDAMLSNMAARASNVLEFYARDDGDGLM